MIAGTLPPIPTMLDHDGRVDPTAIAAVLHKLGEAGAEGIVALGTSGEGMALDRERRRDMLAMCATFAEEHTVVVGCAGQCVPDVLDAVGDAADHGCHAALVPPPFYYPASAARLVDFYDTIATNARLPIMLYHIPQLTGNRLDLDGIRTLADEQNIVGIKDSTADALWHLELLEVQSATFAVLQGAAPLLLLSATLGAAGAIVPGSALFPELELGLRAAVGRGDLAEAGAAARRIAQVAALLRSGGLPLVTNLKALAHLIGLGSCYAEPPAPTAGAAHLEELSLRLRDFRLSG